ncbi:hypothetical protein LMG7974_01782 [Campylobacter majalis]|uniref:DUF465 domain-containing protein n=1 Tax=Campylobacter majalis TaxID=2790656 RepID=A0ABM8QA14_9BACT|nr:DUF465 domain-containing protein [Campylobacter majalis]CAD7289704.1 hypothetical protein LMG7974_01782 [Campylobacter majalis]
MIKEHAELIKSIRANNSHFDALCHKHDELNSKIDKNDGLNAFERDKLKKEKLNLKDQIYAHIAKYKVS